MSSVQSTTRHLVVGSGGWRRWLLSFILISLAIAVTFLLVAFLFPGANFIERLGEAYKVLWQNTTQRQFTFIMRDEPWLLIIPAVTVIFASGLLLPLTYWSRAVYVYIAFGVGVMFGHVFW